MIHDVDTQVTWRKSSYSGPNDNCVIVATFPAGGRGVADSKDLSRRAVVVSRGVWSAFVSAVGAGALDG